MKRISPLVVVFISGKIIFFITFILLYQAVEVWVNDGVRETDQNYPYRSSLYSDSNGYGSNPSENNTINFSDNQTEWNDKDQDGIENKTDISDYGNAGIKVSINSFTGDEIDYTYFDYKVWWDTVDPFFEIEIQCYNEITETWEIIGYQKSKTYWDKQEVLDPMSLICDVDEDTKEIVVKIFAKDYVNIPDYIDQGRIPDTDKPIDICSHINQDYISVNFYPQQNTYKKFDESGFDDPNSLRKGSIAYSIEVIEI